MDKVSTDNTIFRFVIVAFVSLTAFWVQPTRAETWGPDLVADVEVEFNPCGRRSETDLCLRELGLSEAAIRFSYVISGDYSGSSVGISFRELGEVDLAVSQFIGNTLYYTPVLLGETVGVIPIELVRDLRATFRDETSQKMLLRFPNAENIGGVQVSSHRLLPDGTQRFTIMGTILDSCRACPILGSAVTFLDIGPSTGGRPIYRPVALLIDNPDSSVDMTVAVLRSRPESVQVSLNALGYDAGPMDGVLGPQTRTALMEFQIEHCLSPTGQPDTVTLEKLLNADGFETPCARAPLPSGISANSPLFSGIYVDDLEKCSLENLPPDTAHLSQRIIRGKNITWDNEVGCTTQRTDIRDGVTLFSGTCAEGNSGAQSRWRFDILSNQSFIDLDMPAGIPSAQHRLFVRCPANSNLRQSWGAWFGDEEQFKLFPKPEFSAQDFKNWAIFDTAGGDELRDIYTKWFYAASNTEALAEIIYSMNALDENTPPEVVLDYIDWVLENIVQSRTLMVALGGNSMLTDAENGDLYTLWLLNRARNKYQPLEMDYANLLDEGFYQLSPQKSAFHAIGLDAGRIEKWVHSDGREYVFYINPDGSPVVVFDGRNNGTFNYCNSWSCHIVLDILPWVKWGASEEDPSTPEERALLFRQIFLISNYIDTGTVTPPPDAPTSRNDDATSDPASLTSNQPLTRTLSVNQGSVIPSDAITQLLASVPCARLAAKFISETRVLELRGHIPEDSLRAPLLADIRQLFDESIIVDDTVVVLPSPQCDLLPTLANLGLPQSTRQTQGPLNLGATTQLATFEYGEGERVIIRMKSSDFAAYVYVDYFDIDGNVLHLRPNQWEPLQYYQPGASIAVGDDANGQPAMRLIVGPPFGRELVVAYTSSEPLYEGVRDQIEPAEPYLDYLRGRIAELKRENTDFIGDWAYMFVETHD